MDTNGGNAVQLTTSGAADRSPRWSPDGTQIVFTRESVNGSALMAFNTSCMGQTGACEDALTTLSSGRYDLDPGWSPDGRSIVFGASDFPGEPSSLAIVDANGSGFRTVSATDASDFDPTWSPDSRWIAFASNVFEDYDLWLIDAGGGEPRQITKSAATDVQPAWSPQGGWLVYASDSDGDFELYLIEARCATAGEDPAACEGAARHLTENAADDLDPAWGP
jgi:TolB protein